VTGIMAVVSTVLYFAFFALIGRYQETLMSLVESGYRRSYVHEISTGTMPRTHDVRLSVTGRLWHGSWPRGAQTEGSSTGPLLQCRFCLCAPTPIDTGDMYSLRAFRCARDAHCCDEERPR
jgi:hypothetical protein